MLVKMKLFIFCKVRKFLVGNLKQKTQYIYHVLNGHDYTTRTYNINNRPTGSNFEVRILQDVIKSHDIGNLQINLPGSLKTKKTHFFYESTLVALYVYPQVKIADIYNKISQSAFVSKKDLHIFDNMANSTNI